FLPAIGGYAAPRKGEVMPAYVTSKSLRVDGAVALAALALALGGCGSTSQPNTEGAGSSGSSSGGSQGSTSGGSGGSSSSGGGSSGGSGSSSGSSSGTTG